MNYPIKLKTNLAASALLILGSVNLQAQIVASTVDQNYANTTVIYTRQTGNDQAILNQLNDDYGLGDMVRITEAPEMTEKSLANVAPAQQNVATQQKKVIVAAAPVAPKPTQISQPAPKPAGPKAVSKQTGPTESAKYIAVEQKTELKAGTTATSVKKVTTTNSAHKAKSVRKSKKSKRDFDLFKRKYKNKKPGKQRYGCPKF